MKTTSINHFEILKILLEEEHSKRQSDLIIEFIGDDAQKLDALAKHFLGNEYKLAQRAAMPFGNIARTNSKCIEPYLKDAILKINSSNVHDAIIRNVTRILAEIEIPEDIEGITLDLCFQQLENPKSAIAIKVFAMTAIFNLSAKYPEIKPELKLLIEMQLPNGSAGFISRGKKILKKLDPKPKPKRR
jgi:hypothetical protein